MVTSVIQRVVHLGRRNAIQVIGGEGEEEMSCRQGRGEARGEWRLLAGELLSDDRRYDATSSMSIAHLQPNLPVSKLYDSVQRM